MQPNWQPGNQIQRQIHTQSSRAIDKTVVDSDATHSQRTVHCRAASVGTAAVGQRRWDSGDGARGVTAARCDLAVQIESKEVHPRPAMVEEMAQQRSPAATPVGSPARPIRQWPFRSPVDSTRELQALASANATLASLVEDLDARLLFSGKQLEDWGSLEDYNIRAE